MLMTIDVGNTNIAVGVYDGEEIVATFRLITKSTRTSDELGASFYSIMRARDLDPHAVDGAIVSSVVPNINHSIVNSVKKYFHLEPMMVSTKLDTGILTDIKDLGNDRLVTACAAHQEYGPEVLVVDFGTATTYDYVEGNGHFLAGITAPGIQIEADALTNMTAQLPNVELVKPESILTTDTITSIQAGVIYGYIGGVEYIIQSVKNEVNRDFKVVATGGYGSLICPHTKSIDVYDRNLAYKGMKIIWDRNR